VLVSCVFEKLDFGTVNIYLENPKFNRFQPFSTVFNRQKQRLIIEGQDANLRGGSSSWKDLGLAPSNRKKIWAKQQKQNCKKLKHFAKLPVI
jgi:hypothetical protein